jgi:hypothetical protein
MDTGEVGALLARLKAYCLPGGEDAARGVRGVRSRQRGEFRARRDARWMALTADEFVDATQSAFRWDARMGTGLMSVAVTDAYEQGHGRLVVRKGPVPLMKMAGPDVDKGELQRYLANAITCPPMLLHHPSLEWTRVGALTLRVRDRADPTGATVDLELDETGRPISIRAERPMLVGRQSILTAWSAVGTDDREWDGLRVPTRLEASWHPPEGAFTYIRMEVTDFAAVR